MLERSRKEGVRALVSVTEHCGEFERLLRLSESYPDFVMPCFGVHPIQNNGDGPRSVTMKFDFDRNVHSRSAGRQTIAFLKEQGIEKALLHNFAGRPSAALEGVKAGYFFSFPPAVTKNNQREKLIRQIPMENICLETDSPALGPNREERNVPWNIQIPCEYIARVKSLSPETVCEATAQNALRLFYKMNYKLNK
ncbi:putative deoxyribonuclease tatdn3-A [Aquarana catesbeiana]|uniref:putative deoxyribonuclease tatdn3-A n=1 Tax=Aquarana catesbeiana TaxID=8400 RepID=UPI003CC9E413